MPSFSFDVVRKNELSGGSLVDGDASTTLTIPGMNGSTVVTAIGLHALAVSANHPKNTALTQVNLPESINTFRSGAFDGCTALAYNTIPTHVKNLHNTCLSNIGITSLTLNLSNFDTIQSYVFAANKKLRTVVVEKTSAAGPNEIPFGTFAQCDKLEEVDIPEGVVEIGPYAFFGCTSLVTVRLPLSLKKIGHDAFRDCPALTNINLDQLDNLEYIGERAFYGDDPHNKMALLKNLKFTDTENYFEDYDGRTQLDIANDNTCDSGYIFCKNAYDIFNLVGGKLNEDFRLYEIEVKADEKTAPGNNHQTNQPGYIKFTKTIRPKIMFQSYKELFGGTN